MPTQPRAAIANLPAYALADQRLPGVARVIQLGQNELGTAPSAKAMAAASASLADLNRYPDTDHLALRRAIAEVHGLDPGRILCGAGSMELMGLLATVYGEPGAEVVVSRFGYKYFEVQCALAGAAIKVAPEPEMRIDIEAVAAAVTERTRMVFVVDPNNPTGARLEKGALRRLRSRLPDPVLLVLDGAYAEFAPDSRYDSGFAMVDGGENLVVLRTFSKAYGLAALRVGWLYGPDDVVAAVSKARAPNSVTAPGLAAARAAVRDGAHLAAVTREVVTLREAFRQTARSLGLSAMPSGGNFVLIGCPDAKPIAARALDEGLRRSGIIVRPMHSYGLPEHFRVTIGSREDMEALADALHRLL